MPVQLLKMTSAHQVITAKKIALRAKSKGEVHAKLCSKKIMLENRAVIWG